MESRGECQTAPPRAEQRERRFRIVKLEERIAPGGGHGNGSNYSCGNNLSCDKACNYSP
jgi:hypothetical protein